mgnify:CR=1 FL=1
MCWANSPPRRQRPRVFRSQKRGELRLARAAAERAAAFAEARVFQHFRKETRLELLCDGGKRGVALAPVGGASGPGTGATGERVMRCLEL